MLPNARRTTGQLPELHMCAQRTLWRFIYELFPLLKLTSPHASNTFIGYICITVHSSVSCSGSSTEFKLPARGRGLGRQIASSMRMFYCCL
jgi:hypothetical protein